MPPPVISLTSDFGLLDHYVGTIKGVILSRCPDAQLVDISHDIPPFDIYAGAYTISQAAPYFPAGTVHLVVVDPGVGTARRPIAATAFGHFFVAPDNGVLSLVVKRDPKSSAREIANPNLRLEKVSQTFHGRDIFAPVAASLSGGVPFGEVGPVIDDMMQLGSLEPYETQAGAWEGRILSIDRFGNAITNFPSDRFSSLAARGFSLQAGRGTVTEFRTTFGQAEPESASPI